MHPIAFTSKRTFTTEKKYKLYLLEFAALKFRLDKFSSIVWGFPVEIKTDCNHLKGYITQLKPKRSTCALVGKYIGL